MNGDGRRKGKVPSLDGSDLQHPFLSASDIFIEAEEASVVDERNDFLQPSPVLVAAALVEQVIESSSVWNNLWLWN